MKILHTEASPGWGGQELRILREAEGMRSRGHEVILAIQAGGGLVEPARKAGFWVVEMPFKKSSIFSTLYALIKCIVHHDVDLINTHSSLDAWLGGIAARLTGRKVIRTRHLSTPIRKGINSLVLYRLLADSVVTTCEAVVPIIRQQARLSADRCRSIPTGVDPAAIAVTPDAIQQFRSEWKIAPDDLLVGTVCVLRGWKGISDLLQAAALLKGHPHLKWMIVGEGVSQAHFLEQWKALELQESVIFTGHLAPPYVAMGAMDVFALLSWANEGVSQASLQAAWLKKPLITTSIGGLPEVCIDGETGIQVATRCAQEVAQAVKTLYSNPKLREKMGEKARRLVENTFTLTHTLDAMEEVYLQLISEKSGR